MFPIPVLTFKLLILSFISSKRQMIHNRTAQRSTWNQSYDFIIVGAGTSGCVVANRLTENPKVTVLLLEAGGAQDSIYNDIPGMWSSISTYRPDLEWYYYTEPEQFTDQHTSRSRLRLTMGKVIGGSSSHNGMNYYRAQQRDYDNWVKTYGAKSWSYKEVLPFYLRFENNTDMNIVRKNYEYHGVNGPVQISTRSDVQNLFLLTKKVFNDLGFMDTDVNGPNQTGTMIIQSYIDQNGFRSSSGNAYVDPNPHPNNLHILTRAMVLRILFNRLSAVGVIFDRNGTSYRVYARKEVIVCAGPYQTPQLLMLSGIGPQNNLQSFGIPQLLDLPVGNNFQNLVTIPFTSDINQHLINPFPVLAIDNLFELYFNKSGPLSQNPELLLYFSTSNNLDKEWPNLVLVESISNGQLILQVIIGRLLSRGSVRLQSNNHFIPLKVYTNLYSYSQDLDTAVDAVKFLLFLMERTALAQYITPNKFESASCPPCHRYVHECTESIRCYILSQSIPLHPSGTCRMGAIDRNDVVVGPNLLVKHAQNLRICDSSIIPELPNSGLTADILMIGEKCSQIIKDYYDLV